MRFIKIYNNFDSGLFDKVQGIGANEDAEHYFQSYSRKPESSGNQRQQKCGNCDQYERCGLLHRAYSRTGTSSTDFGDRRAMWVVMAIPKRRPAPSPAPRTMRSAAAPASRKDRTGFPL